jgi:Protein of unknown function (DUF1524)/Excalibur calcium-binding domain
MANGKQGSPPGWDGDSGTWWQPETPSAPPYPPPAGPPDRPRRKGPSTWIILGCLAALIVAAGISVSLLAGGPRPERSGDKATTATRATPTPEAHAPGQGDETGTATAVLSTLVVAADGSMQAYARDAFGAAWTDTDRNGCDTRNDILRRDLTAVALEPGTHGCVVLSGALMDPYSGNPMPFKRGGLTIQIDHVVSLGDAWRAGANAWPYAKLLALANDPIELLAVNGGLNEAKGDSDAADWLPPSHICEYAARQVAVKAKYELTITQEEHDALASALQGCPLQALPSGGNPTLAPNRSPAPRPTATTSVAPTGPGRKGADPDYGTCANAQAHGAGPYYAGTDSEYTFYEDRDGDGVVCE